MFPLNVFEGTLWAFQRFDILNAIDMVFALVRVGLTFALIGRGYGLVALALITLLIALSNAAVKAVLCFLLEPTLRISPAHVRRESVRGLFDYGLWYFLLSMGKMITYQISPLIISHWFILDDVTLYGVAARLMGYAGSVMVAGAGVLTPVSTAFHAEEKQRAQQRLFLEGGKYCLMLSLFFTSLFLFLGEPFIALWQGPALVASYGLLVILALGEALPMSQLLTSSIFLGMGRHRTLACLSIAENLVAIPLAIVLKNSAGLAGVCLAVALAAALFRGVGYIIFGCRLLHVPVSAFVTRAVAPAVAAAALPAAGLVVLTAWRVPATWLELVLYGASFGGCYAVAVAFLVGHGRLRVEGVGRLRRVFQVETTADRER
jgi:O-antigen/teichoic acid export membrane protein